MTEWSIRLPLMIAVDEGVDGDLAAVGQQAAREVALVDLGRREVTHARVNRCGHVVE